MLVFQLSHSSTALTSVSAAGYVARLTSTKSPGMFLRVAAELRKLLPNSRFVLAGRETHHGFQALMERFAEDLGLATRTKFLGFTARQDLHSLYSCLDLVFFPSMTQFETFGIVNLVWGRVHSSSRVLQAHGVFGSLCLGLGDS